MRREHLLSGSKSKLIV